MNVQEVAGNFLGDCVVTGFHLRASESFCGFDIIGVLRGERGEDCDGVFVASVIKQFSPARNGDLLRGPGIEGAPEQQCDNNKY
jgi:hypothetical protein